LAPVLSACSDSGDSNSSSSGGNGAGGGASMGGGSNGGGTSTGTHWVGTWAAGLQATEPRNLPVGAPDSEPTPDDPGFAGNTLRQIVHVSIGGSKLRLRLSNEYGIAPVTFAQVHVAQSLGEGSIDTATDKALAFSGMPSVTVPAGEAVDSDAFDYDLEPLSNLAITIQFGEQSKDVTGHPGSRTTSYLQTGDAVTEGSLPDALKTAHWYFIAGLDVMATQKSAAVVVLGDSLTDGRGTTTDGNDRWTDVLAARLQADPNTAHVAVLNQGIGGNALLSGGIGPTAKTRFDHDVLGMPGVKWFIVLAGVNDIGGATSDISSDLIATFQEFITKAHAQDVKAFGATILPFKTNTNYDKGDHLAQRATVNEWIRTGGEFDAVIDLDAAVRDAADPDKLRDDFAELPPSVGTDYLHLNPLGYKAMGEAVDLALFK
jgi:lysophospholipase L1-like esterase